MKPENLTGLMLIAFTVIIVLLTAEYSDSIGITIVLMIIAGACFAKAFDFINK